MNNIPYYQGERLKLYANNSEYDISQIDNIQSNLGERMKLYTDYSNNNISHIDLYTGFVIRLDGHNFSNLFHGIKNREFANFKTPFINDFKLAMEKATRDLVKEFNASIGFTHFNEISLYFKPLNILKNKLFNNIENHCGSVQKLISLTSSYCSARLIKYLLEINYDKFHLITDKISFNSHTIIIPCRDEICNYFIWRSKIECYDNFVSEVYHKYFTKKLFEPINTEQQVNDLLYKKNININDYNIFLRHGTFIKHVDENNTIYLGNYIRMALPDLKCSNDYIDLLETKNFEQSKFLNIDFELLSEI